jgi:hypothetical protein
VLRWLSMTGKEQVTREEVRVIALHRQVDADGAEQVIDSLVRAGWLRKVEVGKRRPGRPASKWEVNPRLWE